MSILKTIYVYVYYSLKNCGDLFMFCHTRYVQQEAQIWIKHEAVNLFCDILENALPQSFHNFHDFVILLTIHCHFVFFHRPFQYTSFHDNLKHDKNETVSHLSLFYCTFFHTVFFYIPLLPLFPSMLDLILQNARTYFLIR
jgi:hypothetical protein